MKKILPIIGMSPGNSYFKDEEVRYLLQKVIARYGQCVVFVADIPAISTYKAFGYPENKARSKAVLKGNNLKNRVRRLQKELNIEDNVITIIDWKKDIDPDHAYQIAYSAIKNLHTQNQSFARDINETTKEVLVGSGRDISDLSQATETAVHYILSEFAFLEWYAAEHTGSQISYVYHKNWPVFEKYVAGLYDNKPKSHLDFILLENPYETFVPLQENEHRDENVIRASFSHYPPAFIKKEDGFGGIFHDLLKEFSQTTNKKIEWVEETGYGVIIDGLHDKRFDIFASTVWPIPERKASVLFSTSLYKSPVYLWVREGETYSQEVCHKDSFTIAVREQDISDSIQQVEYPNARITRIPQLATMNELLGMVAHGIADATFAEPYVVELYNQSSDIQLVRYADTPVRIYENCFIFDKSNSHLVDQLNAFLEIKKKQGDTNKLLQKYFGDERFYIEK